MSYITFQLSLILTNLLKKGGGVYLSYRWMTLHTWTHTKRGKRCKNFPIQKQSYPTLGFRHSAPSFTQSFSTSFCVRIFPNIATRRQKRLSVIVLSHFFFPLIFISLSSHPLVASAYWHATIIRKREAGCRKRKQALMCCLWAKGDCKRKEALFSNRQVKYD